MKGQNTMTPQIAAVITTLVQWGFSVKINSVSDKDVLFDCRDGNTDYTKNKFNTACMLHGVKLDIWSDADRVFGAFYK
jgi:hypothetical protein